MMLERCLSASVINGKTELSIRADTNATEPMSPEREVERGESADSFPINSNYVYVGEERSVRRVFYERVKTEPSHREKEKITLTELLKS